MSDWALLRANALSFGQHLVFGVLAVIVGAVAINLVDRFVMRRIDLEQEIARGNLAAAIYAGSIWLALALIVAFVG